MTLRPTSCLADWTYQFGAGSRTCLGKNISLMEMSKLVPQIIRRFKLEPVKGGQPWRTENWWLVKQFGLECCVKRRT